MCVAFFPLSGFLQSLREKMQPPTITTAPYHLSVTYACESAEPSHITVISRTVFDLSTHGSWKRVESLRRKWS